LRPLLELPGRSRTRDARQADQLPSSARSPDNEPSLADGSEQADALVNRAGARQPGTSKKEVIMTHISTTTAAVGTQ